MVWLRLELRNSLSRKAGFLIMFSISIWLYNINDILYPDNENNIHTLKNNQQHCFFLSLAFRSQVELPLLMVMREDFWRIGS